MLQHFLSSTDAERALQTFAKLGRHDLSRWVLAGGLAVEIHCLRGGTPPCMRHLNDIDFIAASFDDIPETLANEFLFRHIHPFDPPGKTILQFIDADRAMRIDLFRANPAVMSRAGVVEFPWGQMQLIALVDAVARTARLLMDLEGGVPVASKHAHDYLRMVNLVHTPDLEVAWRDHRRPAHPMTFSESDGLIRHLLATRRDLLITPDYSKDTAATCARCAPHGRFRLADASAVFACLGYC